MSDGKKQESAAANDVPATASRKTRSVVLARLIEEVRNEQPYSPHGPHAFDRSHNRHNRG